MRRLIYCIAILLFFIYCDGPEFNNPPTLQISADVSSGICPLTVSFSAQASDRDGDSLSFEWDFGDGSDYSKEQNPVHIYNLAGVFTVLCAVADNGNPPKSATATLEITVQPLKPQIDSISPQSKLQHMPAFTLTVTGSNFQNGAEIIFNNIPKTTTYLSSTQLRCEISTEEITISALQVDRFEMDEIQDDFSIPVVVRNPAPCGTDSDTINFILLENHTFKNPVKITSHIADYPAISYDKSRGNINIISYLNGLNFSQSIDQGKTWSNKKIADCPTNSSDGLSFVIKTDNSGNINLVWSYLHVDWGYSVVTTFMRSENSGIDWWEPESLFGGQWGILPDLAIGNSKDLYLVWRDWHEECGAYMCYSYSNNGGLTWASWSELYWILTEARGLSLAIDSSKRLHLGFLSEDIFYAQMSGGWSGCINISNSTWKNAANPICLAYGSDNIYLVWRDGESSSTRYLFFSRSTDGGTTWSAPDKIVNNPSGIETISAAVDSVGNINIVFIMNSNLYFMRSIDDGLNWTSPVRITTINTAIGKHALDVDDMGNLHITWRDTSADANLYYSTNEF